MNDFTIDYNVIDTTDILEIHKAFNKNNIITVTKCFDLLKKNFFIGSQRLSESLAAKCISLKNEKYIDPFLFKSC